MTNFSLDFKNKREKNQINKSRNEKGEFITGNSEIQSIKNEYYEQIYGNKIDNLKEMDRVLEKFNLARLSQEEIEIMSNLITSTVIEAVIKISQKAKANDQLGSHNSTKHLGRDNVYPSKTLSKICTGRNTSKLIL